MQPEDFTIRDATSNDLERINQVIEQAIMTWDLPERVKMLALPSYRYSYLDLQHMQLIVAAEPSGGIVGVAAWEKADISETPEGRSALLLHGLYISPDLHKQGLGSRLLARVEQLALDHQMTAALVKAQADAVNFFAAKGYRQLAAVNAERDYQNRFWKRLAT